MSASLYAAAYLTAHVLTRLLNAIQLQVYLSEAFYKLSLECNEISLVFVWFDVQTPTLLQIPGRYAVSVSLFSKAATYHERMRICLTDFVFL